METSDFKTVYASVRPARTAVLVNREYSDWTEICRRIIEFFSSLWGGEHSLIVPTDGTTILPIFWQILEAFAPDYVCCYHKSGIDIRTSERARFQETVERYLNANYGPGERTDAARQWVENQLASAVIPWAIDPLLEAQLKDRLAPFFHEESVTHTGMQIDATAVPTWPRTAVGTILDRCEHPKTIGILHDGGSGVPQLWIEAAIGSVSARYRDVLVSRGVEVEVACTTGEDPAKLVSLAVGDRAREDAWNPFRLSMVGLSKYQSMKHRAAAEPTIVVFGDTIDDFALYFNLKRLCSRVYWLIPSWLLTGLAVSGRWSAHSAASQLARAGP